MFRSVAFAALSAGLLAASACAPITTYSGFQAIDASPKEGKVGEDTKSTVRARLGSPSVVSTFEGALLYAEPLEPLAIVGAYVVTLGAWLTSRKGGRSSGSKKGNGLRAQ